MEFTYQEAAICQLESAIQFFQIEKYVECSTLAGAADELLGKACRDKNIQSSFDSIKDIASALGNEHHAVARKEINEPRNTLKHGNFGYKDLTSKIVVTKFDAYLLLLRATRNSYLLGITQSEVIHDFIQSSKNMPLSEKMLDE